VHVLLPLGRVLRAIVATAQVPPLIDSRNDDDDSVRAYVRTCVRAYVRTCVRAYVRTCVRAHQSNNLGRHSECAYVCL
jgi:hypothetical protein